MDTKKVWFVTGASKGLGLFLVKRLLKEGHCVAATSRTIDRLEKAVGIITHFLPLEMDPMNEQSVKTAIDKSIEKFGSIDVVVNNAGYGQFGTLEELSDEEARQNFDINVFGALNVIRNSMPYLRRRKKGHIINVSSIAGFTGAFSNIGIYSATKFALAGLTEALSVEAKDFNIKASIVYPGYFRTNFLDKDSLRLPQKPISGYTSARNSEHWLETEINGNQPGDPERAARGFIQLAESENPPLHFFMGSDSFAMANHKIGILQDALKINEALSKSTDY